MLATDEFKLLGSSLFLIPVGLCVAGWMWIGHARRMAAVWTIAFGASLGIVAASKIAYIGWGFEIEALAFQGFSGHAMRATAISPVILYLILHDAPRVMRIAGIAAGILFGALMAIAVSVYDTHSASESIAGFLLGAAASLGFIRLARAMPKPVLAPSRVAAVSVSSIALVTGTLTVENDPTYQWLEYAALYLSGNEKPYSHAYEPEPTSQLPAGS